MASAFSACRQKRTGGKTGEGCGSRGGGAATNNIFAILILSTSDYSFAVCHHVTREQNKTPAWHRLGREKQAKPSMQKEKNDEKDLIILHCCGWHIPVKVIKSYKLLELAVYHPRKHPCAWTQIPGWWQQGPGDGAGHEMLQLAHPQGVPEVPHTVQWERTGNELC